MNRARRPVPVTAALVLAGAATAVLLASCAGSGDDPGGGFSGDAGSGTVEETEDLALGTPAEIEFFSSGPTPEPNGTGTVAVTAVRKGSTQDLVDAGYALEPDQRSSTPYYVDLRFENDGTTPVEPREPAGTDAEEGLILSLVLINLDGQDFTPCPGVPDSLEPGARAHGCSILLVPSGHTLERISYLPGGTAETIYWKAA